MLVSPALKECFYIFLSPLVSYHQLDYFAGSVVLVLPVLAQFFAISARASWYAHTFLLFLHLHLFIHAATFFYNHTLLSKYKNIFYEYHWCFSAESQITLTFPSMTDQTKFCQSWIIEYSFSGFTPHKTDPAWSQSMEPKGIIRR